MPGNSKGNPNHKGSGLGGGQFASAPGSGGTAKQHGKHWAKRQRQKARKAKNRTKERKNLRKKLKGKSYTDRQKATKSLREKHAGERKSERQPIRVKQSESPKSDKSKLTDRERKGKPKELSAKAALAQKHMSITDKTTQDYTKANEHVFANRIGGKAFPDNAPIDVNVPGGGVGGKDAGIELKTLTHGKNDKITMSKGAIERKDKWETANRSQMHTIALDHRDRVEGGKNAELHSGHEIYYKRGVGSFRIGTMYKAKDEAELKALLKTPYSKLPKEAQGPVRNVKRAI